MKRMMFFSILFVILNIFPISYTMGKQQFSNQENAPFSKPSDSFLIFIPIIIKELPEYFVSPDGSDTNPGTFLLPWKTIGKAAAMVNAGDTVYIRGGVYIEAPRFIANGTELKPIKILAYPGETPVIDGMNQLPVSYRGLVSILGDWVTISGLEVRNSKYVGLGLYGKHILADNIFAHHSQKSGIYIGGDYGIVEDSRIWRNSMQNEYGNGTNWSSGLVAGRDDTDGLTEHAIMRNNIVWENWGQGIDTYESDQTIMIDNISHDNFITNIYISDSTNVLCQRNFVYMNPGSNMYGYGSNVGIMIGDEVYTPPSANIKVINNISFGNRINLALWKGIEDNRINSILIANNTFVNSIGAAGVILRGYHQNVRFENNIVQQDDSLPLISIELDPDVSFSNNLWSKSPDADASGSGDVIGDPLLVKAGDNFEPNWFRLTALSPAIDQALSIPEVIEDYFGVFRGSTPDMGAIEYNPD